MIDLSRAIKYPFKGPNALTKTFVGALLYLFWPIFLLSGMVLLGYQIRIIRDVIHQRDESLPEWDDMGHDFMEGLKVFLGSVLYYLPAMVFGAAGASRIWAVLNDMLSNLNITDLVLGGQVKTVERGDIGVICLLFTLAMLWLVVSAPLIMTALARYAETEEFSAFTNLARNARDVWEQRSTASMLMLNLFALGVVTQAVSAVVSLLGIGCIIGGYLQYIQFVAVCHLGGQWGAVLKERRPARKVIRPIKPPKRV